MNKLEKQFEDYFYEVEKFALRAERFYDDLAIPKMKEREIRMKKWMQAAFIAGAEYAAKESARIAELKEQDFGEYDPNISVGWYIRQKFDLE